MNITTNSLTYNAGSNTSTTWRSKNVWYTEPVVTIYVNGTRQDPDDGSAGVREPRRPLPDGPHSDSVTEPGIL